jgi:HAD superfamily hydrolase (TIGR01549 family)
MGGHLPDKPIQALKGRVVRCILFDLGDTLWFRGDIAKWEQLEASANQRAVALLREHVASQLPANLDDLALGSRLRDAFNHNVRTSIRRHPHIEPGGPSAALETLLQWGIKGIDITLGDAIFEAMRVRIPESRPLFEDTLSTLDGLQQRKFLLGVVTNRIWGGQPFQEDMQTLGLQHYFDLRTIAVSADLGVRKPNPAIFLHALHALNVAPEEAVMVGDSLSTDIVGAQGLGIFAIWKPKSRVRERIQAHLRTTSASTDVSNVQQTPLELEIDPEELSAYGPPPGMHVTDDDYVLTPVRRSDYLEKYLSGEIVPDLIIEHLYELLNLLTEVGVQ